MLERQFSLVIEQLQDLEVEVSLNICITLCSASPATLFFVLIHQH